MCSSHCEIYLHFDIFSVRKINQGHYTVSVCFRSFNLPLLPCKQLNLLTVLNIIQFSLLFILFHDKATLIYLLLNLCDTFSFFSEQSLLFNF